jgi:hypothetical protein
MPDAIRAAMKLMDAPASAIKERGSYPIAEIYFSPQELGDEISIHVRPFEITYLPDYRQLIAENWPASIDDSLSCVDGNWKPAFDLKKMTKYMVIPKKLPV